MVNWKGMLTGLASACASVQGIIACSAHISQHAGLQPARAADFVCQQRFASTPEGGRVLRRCLLPQELSASIALLALLSKTSQLASFDRQGQAQHTLKGPSIFMSAVAAAKASERKTLATAGLVNMCLYRLRMLLQDSKNLTSSPLAPPRAVS